MGRFFYEDSEGNRIGAEWYDWATEAHAAAWAQILVRQQRRGYVMVLREVVHRPVCQVTSAEPGRVVWFAARARPARAPQAQQACSVPGRPAPEPEPEPERSFRLYWHPERLKQRGRSRVLSVYAGGVTPEQVLSWTSEVIEGIARELDGAQ